MTVAGRETYGEKFRRLREQLGWSQAEAAMQLGVSKQSVYLWEAGKRQFNSPEQSETIRHCLNLLRRRVQWQEKRT